MILTMQCCHCKMADAALISQFLLWYTLGQSFWQHWKIVAIYSSSLLVLLLCQMIQVRGEGRVENGGGRD